MAYGEYMLAKPVSRWQDKKMNYSCLPKFLLILFLLSASPPLASEVLAVWEHAPLSSATRLPASRDVVWEFAMIFNTGALYPAVFTCPAGYRVRLHVLNLADRKIQLQFNNPRRFFTLHPGQYEKIDLGNLKPGEHVFYVNIILEQDCRHAEIPDKLRCLIRAGSWPGDDIIYRSAWIAHTHDFTPAELILPAGKENEVFVCGIKGTMPFQFQAGGYTFKVNPEKVTLTDMHRPPGVKLKLPAAAGKKGSLHIR